jgi:uncharacterized cupredoxin-like copper-binding protein
MKKRFALCSLMVVLVWTLAACSSGASTKILTTLDITVSDSAFSPAEVTVPAGKMITVNLKNTGAAAHTWTVMSTPISGTFVAADSAYVFISSDIIEAGASFAFIFKAPVKPGVYQILCTQPGDFENGMVGSLTVK